MPNYARAFGLSAVEGGSSITVLVPKVNGTIAEENLRTNPNIALNVANLTNYKTRQFKGRKIEMREASVEEFEIMKALRKVAAEPLGQFFGPGLADSWDRSVIWPAWAITMTVESIYDQTPGKMAGVKLL